MKLTNVLFFSFLVVKGWTMLVLGCPSDWKNTPYGCFLTVTPFLPYDKAKQNCEEKGAHLITALRNTSLHRRNFFQNVISIEHSSDTLVGLKYRNGGWYWEDGVPARAMLSQALGSDPDRPCAQIGPYDTYSITSVSCASYSKFICEKKINVTVFSTVVLSSSIQSHTVMPPISTSQITTSISTNIQNVLSISTPSLEQSSISSDAFQGMITAFSSMRLSSKSSQDMTTTSSSHSSTLLYVTSRLSATSTGGQLQDSSSEATASDAVSSTIVTRTSFAESEVKATSSSRSYVNEETTQYIKATTSSRYTPWSLNSSVIVISPSATVHVFTQPSHGIILTTSQVLTSKTLTPCLFSKAPSSTPLNLGVTSTPVSEVLSVLYKSIKEEMKATVWPHLSTMTQAMSATSIMHSTATISVGLVPPNETVNEKVSKYLKRIGGLNSTLPTSAKFASELTANLLKSIAKSGKVSSKQMIAIDTFENFLYRYGNHHLTSSNREMRWNTTSMAVQIMKIYESHEVQLHSPNNEVSVYFVQDNLPIGTILAQVLYDDLHLILPSLFKGSSEKFQIGSKVTSILRKHPLHQTALKKNVTISFKNLKSKRGSRRISDSRKCVFWNNGHKDGEWSDEGCTVLQSSDEQTVCSCNHLTSFAVLMQTEKREFSSSDYQILNILTIVGLSLSLLGSTATFIAYFTLTDRKSDQSQIRLNLVASLWMAHILFLTGIRAIDSLVLCVMIAALLQLFFSASLCWMLVEGIQLYFRIVRVYNAEMVIKACYLFAWGFPAAVVCVSLIISSLVPKGFLGYVQEDICWVSHHSYLAWVFVVPVSLILIANLMFFLRVMREISKVEIRQPKPQRVSTVRRNLKACFLLFPLLGITWFTGCFIMFHPDIIFIYIFTILNSTQGFFIFLFHCIGNREIRSMFKKKIYPNHSLTRIAKKSNPIPLAVASVSNMFRDDIGPGCDVNKAFKPSGKNQKTDPHAETNL